MYCHGNGSLVSMCSGIIVEMQSFLFALQKLMRLHAGYYQVAGRGHCFYSFCSYLSGQFQSVVMMKHQFCLWLLHSLGHFPILFNTYMQRLAEITYYFLNIFGTYLYSATPAKKCYECLEQLSM